MDGALTHESLVEYLIEEAYEVVDSIEAGASGSDTSDELRGELGDVLLQVVLHARLAEEQGQFTFDDVARAITDKMVRRNPTCSNRTGPCRNPSRPPWRRSSKSGTP
ncbi:nucleoside triphosphate pyrophosphohydrolase/pyrophosphatase MazG [Arthrobacter sp. Hiyo8]|nr:nucleoside triphosphate pyrophosphohydrolase/pyrophosphatase MazG [Arthrobacter sp. Hiyo8]